MPFDERGEMIGHIALGIELVNSLWRKIETDERATEWQSSLRRWRIAVSICCISIASHHGEPQFGSPVYPKTPEALALNYIDNLDARLEMILCRLSDRQSRWPHGSSSACGRSRATSSNRWRSSENSPGRACEACCLPEPALRLAQIFFVDFEADEIR